VRVTRGHEVSCDLIWAEGHAPIPFRVIRMFLGFGRLYAAAVRAFSAASPRFLKFHRL
jgi:hypothetical protein